LPTYQLPPWVWPLALTAVCAIALWRGRGEEKLAAGGNLAAWALTRLVFEARSEHVQWPVLAIDTAFLVLLLWLALRSGRFWPLFAAGFQLLGVATHLASALDPRLGGWTYLTAALVWNYMVLFTIGYAAWTAPRRYASAPAEAGATRR
jgi:hypothetical protein